MKRIGILLVGLVLLVGGVSMITRFYQFSQKADKVTALIVEVESERDIHDDIRYTAYVDYSYQGKDYKHLKLNSYEHGMDEGKQVTLLINPEYPEEPETEHASYGIGGMMSLVGIGAVIYSIFLMRKQQA